ncbi:MAG: hypothetical protein ACRDGQ_00980, partial [Candidatus Limnocylindrales bacterium]
LGTGLAAGDEIRVTSAGHATIQLGASQVRLAGGSDLRLDSLSDASIGLNLLAGRAYSRVSLAAGGTYAVATGPYTWTATGTAFDLAMAARPGGGAQVTLLALEHAVTVDGPDAESEIQQGSSATVEFGGSNPSGLTIGSIPTSAFSDAWLIANAQTDEQLGDPIGALAGVALAPNGPPTSGPGESIGPGESPTDNPVASPGPSGLPSGSPAPVSTPVLAQSPTPTPTPTDKATPTASPTPTPRTSPSFNLAATSCPNGIVLTWSKYTGPGFVRYVTLRDGSQISTASSTNQGITVGFDLIKSTTHVYQTEALGSGGKVLAASPTETFYGRPKEDLGPLSVYNDRFVWSAGSLPAGCFSEYRVLYTTSTDPTTHMIRVTNEDQGNVAIPAQAWSTGETITFNVVAVRTTPLGDLLVADSEAVTYPHP